MTKLYLGEAFGWETESRSKMIISQLREENKIVLSSTCPKRQLVKNDMFRLQSNSAKLLGYIPVINIIMGLMAIYYSSKDSTSGPNHRAMWIFRGIATILTGPLLIVADLAKTIFDQRIVAKYHREHPQLIQQFNVPHKHSPSYWPGHPVRCLEKE